MSDNVRLNSERGIEHPYIKLKIGTTNRLNPRAIYIEGRTFVIPKFDFSDYKGVLSDIKGTLKQALIQELHKVSYFDNKYILDFSISENGLKKGKNSFLSFQITLRQSGETPMDIKTLKPLSEKMVCEIADQLTKSVRMNNFLINKTKK